jgi:hypothetical protein
MSYSLRTFLEAVPYARTQGEVVSRRAKVLTNGNASLHLPSANCLQTAFWNSGN